MVINNYGDPDDPGDALESGSHIEDIRADVECCRFYARGWLFTRRYEVSQILQILHKQLALIPLAYLLQI